MVGILVSFWNGLFPGAVLVSGMVNSLKNPMAKAKEFGTWKTDFGAADGSFWGKFVTLAVPCFRLQLWGHLIFCTSFGLGLRLQTLGISLARKKNNIIFIRKSWNAKTTKNSPSQTNLPFFGPVKKKLRQPARWTLQRAVPPWRC